MFSPLSRGYASWNGELYDPYTDKTPEKLPSIDSCDPQHRHGITVGQMSRSSTSLSFRSNHTAATHPQLGKELTMPDGQLAIPKTYLTRKGALVLFSSLNDSDGNEDGDMSGLLSRQKMVQINKLNVAELCNKLGTMERLSLSILQYGDQEYDHENASVTDEKNKMFLKFLNKQLEHREVDQRVQPGSELSSYLRDLKYRASSRIGYGDTSIPRSRETMELRALLRGLQENTWPLMYSQDGYLTERSNSFAEQYTHPNSRLSNRAASPLSGTATPRSILSSKKLCASLKSVNSYMGRPASTIPDQLDMEDEESISSTVISAAGHLQSTWSQPSVPIQANVTCKTLSTQGFVDSKGDRAPSPQRPNQTLGVPMSMTGNSITEEAEADLQEAEGHSESQGYRPSSRSQSTSGTALTGTVISEEDGPYKFAVEVEVKGSGSVFSSEVEEFSQGESIIKTGDREENSKMSVAVGDRDSHMQDLTTRDNEDVTLVEGSDGSDLEILYTAGESDRLEMVEGRISDNLVETLPNFSSSPIQNKKNSEPLQTELSTSSLTPPRVDSQSNTLVEETVDDPQEGVSSVSVAGEVVDTLSVQGDQLEQTETSSITEDVEPIRIKVDIQNIVTGPITEHDTASDIKPQDLSVVAEEDRNVTSVIENALEDFSKDSPQEFNRKVSREATPIQQSPILSQQATPVNQTPRHMTPDIKTAGHSPNESHSTSSQMMTREITPTSQGIVTDNGEALLSADIVSTQVVVNKSEVMVAGVVAHDEVTHDVVDGTELDDRVSVASSLLEEQDIILPQDLAGVTEEQTAAEHRQNLIGAAQPLLPQYKGVMDSTAVDDIPPAPGGTPRSSKASSPTGSPSVMKQNQQDEVPHMLEEPKTLVSSDVEDQGQSKGDTESKPIDAEVKTDEKTDPKHTKAAGEFDADILDLVKKHKKLPQKPGVPRKGQLPRGKKITKKDPTKAIGITSVQAEGTEAPPKTEEPKEEVPQKKIKIPVEKPKTIIPEYVAEAAQRRPSESKAELEKEMKQMSETMKKTLGSPMTEYQDMEGMSAEELALAQKDMKDRVEKAKGALDQTKSDETDKKPAPEKKGTPRKGTQKKKAEKPKDEMAEEKARLKELRQLEKQQRLEEAKALQEKISEKQAERKAKEKETRDKAKELELEMERLKREAEEMELAEEEARKVMAEVRRKQREERDAARKADLERKKKQIRDRREAEKRMLEEARKKEQEMLSRIPDEDIRRRQREEEERKRDEEERLAEERIAEELREAERLAEEEEERIRELQRQAMEESMERLREEQEEAARKLRQMEEQKRLMEEEEERKRQLILEEELRLEKEQMKRQEEEDRKREEERMRILQLQQMEQEAKEHLQQEIIARREAAMARREVNLERKSNMDKLRHKQGITPPWVWSYFIPWPKESYDIPIGGPPQQKGIPGGRRKKKR